jgi:Cu-Zn family superoxide dismutase
LILQKQQHCFRYRHFYEKNGKVAKISRFKTERIYIHEKSDCSLPTQVPGHWNPTFKKHKWGVEYHKGDIGNFTADANGNGTITNYR